MDLPVKLYTRNIAHRYHYLISSNTEFHAKYIKYIGQLFATVH